MRRQKLGKNFQIKPRWMNLNNSGKTMEWIAVNVKIRDEKKLYIWRETCY